MKYMILLFLALFGQGVNANKKTEVNSFFEKNWCIDSDEVEEWTLVDRKGKLYVFTDSELNAVSNTDYDLIVENLRVKKVIFRDIIPKD